MGLEPVARELQAPVLGPSRISAPAMRGAERQAVMDYDLRVRLRMPPLETSGFSRFFIDWWTSV